MKQRARRLDQRDRRGPGGKHDKQEEEHPDDAAKRHLREGDGQGLQDQAGAGGRLQALGEDDGEDRQPGEQGDGGIGGADIQAGAADRGFAPQVGAVGS